MNQNQEDAPQIVTTGRLKENSVGAELITFSVRLGFFKLVCIVNVPDEGQTEAPVYVKFTLLPPRPRDEDRRHQARD
jgi:hypothetical protein